MGPGLADGQPGFSGFRARLAGCRPVGHQPDERRSASGRAISTTGGRAATRSGAVARGRSQAGAPANSENAGPDRPSGLIAFYSNPSEGQETMHQKRGVRRLYHYHIGGGAEKGNFSLPCITSHWTAGLYPPLRQSGATPTRSPTDAKMRPRPATFRPRAIEPSWVMVANARCRHSAGRWSRYCSRAFDTMA